MGKMIESVRELSGAVLSVIFIIYIFKFSTKADWRKKGCQWIDPVLAQFRLLRTVDLSKKPLKLAFQAGY